MYRVFFYPKKVLDLMNEKEYDNHIRANGVGSRNGGIGRRASFRCLWLLQS